MRLTDDYYEEERESKSFLYMIVLMSVVILGVVGLIFWMNQGGKSGSNYELAKQQAEARRQAAGISDEQVPKERSVDSLISGSSLTSDQLNIWDLSELNSVEETETPKSTKNGTVTNQTTGETIVDGSLNSGSENSAAKLAEGKTSVYDMSDKEDEDVADEEKTEEAETEEIDPETQTLITRADGKEEWVEINENLAKNSYSKSRFVFKDPIMSYYLNGKEASWCGVDISSKQDSVDFKKLKKAGCDFVMIKVGGRGYSSGEIVLDEKFKDYMKSAQSAGLEIGVYFFSQAITKDEVDEEAETLVEAIKDFTVKYPVVFRMQEVEGDMARVESLDTESRTELAKRFLNFVEDAGYKPMLYGDKEWLVTKVDLEELDKYDVWLEQEADTPDYPYEFNMWQYDKSGTINGISEETGLNICFVDYTKE